MRESICTNFKDVNCMWRGKKCYFSSTYILLTSVLYYKVYTGPQVIIPAQLSLLKKLISSSDSLKSVTVSL